jgi:NACHT domain.
MTDTLKLKVEETFGKKITTQKDCTSLSYKILEETGEIISQSTIRRFWGLLKSNSQTSKKTIESLCIYCGYKSWDEFVQQNSGKSASEIFNEKLWISSIRRCNAETTSTLEIIKRRCGIKFELAIDRKFAADRLDLFLRSHYTATALIGPGGFGKSTMMAKWIHKEMEMNSDNDKILLLLNGTKLESSIGIGTSFKQWLLHRITGSSNMSIAELVGKSKNNKKVIVVIDGLDEIRLSDTKLQSLFEQIVEMINEHTNSGLKIILTARNTTWENYFLPIFNKTAHQPNSWLGIQLGNSSQNLTNIPPLSRVEIQRILNHTINNLQDKKIIVEDLELGLRHTLAYPYYLQLFINTGAWDKANASVSNFDLMNEFLKSQIYNSNLADEKLDIINAILSLQKFGSLPNLTPKNDLKKLFPINLKTAGKYYDAYQDLISYGIIDEEIVESKFKTLSSAVSFANENLRCALILRAIIEENDGVNYSLFEKIDNNYTNIETKAQLISLLFNEAYKSRNHGALILFFNLNYETLKAAIAQGQIGQALRNDKYMQNQLIPEFAKNPTAQELLFENNIDMDYLNISFKNMLKEYLKYKADREARIFGNSLLALSSIFQLDRPTATLYINEIKKLNPRIGDKPTNIAHWLGSQMLYSYFTEGTIKKELLDSIPTFQKIAHKVNSSYAIWGKAEFEREIALTLLIAKEYSLAEEIINSGNKYFACFKEESNTSVPPECIIIQSIAEWGQTKQLSIETAMQIENLLESVQGPNSITPKVLSSAVIGTFYFYQNKSDKFNSYFQSALELVALNQNKMWEVILLKMLASLLHLLGETRSAEQCEIYAKGLVENSGFLFEKF